MWLILQQTKNYKTKKTYDCLAFILGNSVNYLPVGCNKLISNPQS